MVGPTDVEARPSRSQAGRSEIWRRGSWERRKKLFIGTVIVAASLALGIYALFPKQLDVSTDIIGYPIAANFDITRYTYRYEVAVVVFPALALAIYA